MGSETHSDPPIQNITVVDSDILLSVPFLEGEGVVKGGGGGNGVGWVGWGGVGSGGLHTGPQKGKSLNDDFARVSSDFERSRAISSEFEWIRVGSSTFEWL